MDNRAGGARRQGRRAKHAAELYDRLAEDFAAFRTEQLNRAEAEAAAAGVAADPMLADATTAILRSVAPPRPADANPALLRLRALIERDGPAALTGATAPVAARRPAWTPLGPVARSDEQANERADGQVGGPPDGVIPAPISGRVTAIVPHPTDPARIWIGTSHGGVWRTDDGAVTWHPLTDDQPSLAVGALAAGTDDPEVLYAGTGEGNVQLYGTVHPQREAPGVYLGVGVLRSADGGTTWTHHAAPLLAGAAFYRIAVDRTDANRAFGATSRGLVRTTDGANWALLSGSGLPPLSADVIACCDVVIDRADPTGNTVYAAFWGSGIYRSTDALSTSPTFTPLGGGLPAGPATSRISLSQSPSDPSFVYALIAGADPGGGLTGLYRSTAPDGSIWERCTKSRTIQLHGTFTNAVTVDPATPDTVYVSGMGVYRCVRNRRGAWRVTDVGGAAHPDNHALAFHPTRSQVLYAGNDGGFLVSPDGGLTWDDSPDQGRYPVQDGVIDTRPGWPGDGESLPGLVGRISARWASDAVSWCASTAGQVYQLTRSGPGGSGRRWTVRAPYGPPLPAGQWIGAVAGVPGDDDAVVVAFGGFGLAEHVWRGDVPATGPATWSPVSTGLPDVPMYALCLASPTEWYVGTDIGVWRSVDGGQRWEAWSQGLPNTAVHDLRLHDGSTLLRAATRGRGLWEIDTRVEAGLRSPGGRRR